MKKTILRNQTKSNYVQGFISSGCIDDGAFRLHDK